MAAVGPRAGTPANRRLTAPLAIAGSRPLTDGQEALAIAGLFVPDVMVDFGMPGSPAAS